nr:helix-turn-helix domain-containing protein [Microlunatus speluncae]
MTGPITTVRELGTSLRARRRGLGLTQHEVAQQARVTRQWLVRLEHGHHSAELGLVLDVARALGVAIEFRPLPEQVPGEVDLDQVLDELT